MVVPPRFSPEKQVFSQCQDDEISSVGNLDCFVNQWLVFIECREFRLIDMPPVLVGVTRIIVNDDASLSMFDLDILPNCTTNSL